MLAALADGLTVLRLPIAVAVAVVAAAGRLDLVGILLAVAWSADFLDGRLAGWAGGGTKLGPWDLAADTLVGTGAVIGLTAGGLLPAGLGVPAVVVLGGLAWWRRNPAPAMLLQGIGYGAYLWLAWTTGAPWRVLPLATVAAIALVDADRFVHRVLPMFFDGAARLFRWDSSIREVED